MTSNRFDASSSGEIRSRVMAKSKMPSRIFKPHKTSSGYLHVTVLIDGAQMNRNVHRLVADAFLGPCPAGFQVNHIDSDKNNNRPGNLEYVTAKQNSFHAVLNGHWPRLHGERNPMSRLIYKQVAEIREIKKINSLSQRAIAKKFNVSPMTVSRVVNNKTWTLTD